jgi:hypothetical protein
MWAGGALGGRSIAGIADRFKDTQPDPFLGLVFSSASESKSFLLVANPYDPHNYNILRASEDPTDSVWAKTAGETVGGSVSDPEGGTDAWYVDTNGSTALEGVTQTLNQLTTGPAKTGAGALVALRIWLQAGDADADSTTADLLMINSSNVAQDIGSVRKVAGPGSISVVTASGGDTARAESLSETEWSCFEVVWSATVPSAGDTGRLAIAPGEVDQTQTARLNVFRPQVQAQDTLVHGRTTPVRATTDEQNGPEGAPGRLVPVYLSNNGYKSHPTDTPDNQIYGAVVKVPYNAEVNILSSDEVAVRSSPTFGDIEILNPRVQLPSGHREGEFDHTLLTYSWGNRALATWFGDRGDPLTQFTKIFDGSAAAVSWDASILRVSMRDRIEEIDSILQPETYQGRGFAFRFREDVSQTHAGGASTIADISGTTESLWCEFWYRRGHLGEAAGGNEIVMGQKNAHPAANPGWLFWTWTNAGSVFMGFVVSDGTNQLTFTDNIDVNDGQWHHFAGLYDGAQAVFSSKTLALYMDGALVGTDSAPALSSAPDGGANEFRIGNDGAGGTWGLDADIDEVIIEITTDAERIQALHDSYVTDVPDAVPKNALRRYGVRANRRLYASEIDALEVPASPGTTIDPKLIYLFNEGATEHVGNSGSQASSDLTMVFGGGSERWIGSGEGPVELTDKFKPVAIGQLRSIEPVLIDAADGVYQVNYRGVQAITNIRDGGDILGSGTYTDVGASDDVYSATKPARGDAKTDLKVGWFRLGGAALGVITCDVQGDDDSALGYVDDAANVVRLITTEWGGLTYPDDFDVASFTAVAAARPDTLGYYARLDEVRIPAALDEIMLSVGGYWGFTREGLLRIGILDVPDAGDVTATFEDDDVIIDTLSLERRVRPLHKLRLGYQRFWRPLSESELADGLGIIPEHVWAHDGAVYVDETADAISLDGASDGQGDVALGPSGGWSSNVDGHFVAHATSPFGGILYSMAQPFEEADTENVIWRYWDGGAWVTLGGSDETRDLKNTGLVERTWDIPEDWATTTVNGEGPFYWIRVTSSSGSGSGEPRANWLRLINVRDPSTVVGEGLRQEYRTVHLEDSDVLVRHANAEDREVNTLLDSELDARAEAERQLAMFGELRDLYRVRIRSGLFAYNVGDTVELKVSRFGLEDGKVFVVVGWVEDLSDPGKPSVTLVLWG